MLILILFLVAAAFFALMLTSAIIGSSIPANVKLLVALKQMMIDVAQMMSGPITDLINAVVALMYDIENLLEKVLLLLNA